MRREHFVVVLIILAAAARAVTLQWLHPVTWDEIEFFRVTKWVSQGLVPYRDFWEHHTPLLWFAFAPVAAFIDWPGVSAIVAMRWAQVPIWTAGLIALFVYMRDAGLSLISRLSVIVLILCSSMFMLAAVEYRIDTLGCALYLIALLFLQRLDRQRWYAYAAGAAICLAGFANIRLGPLLVTTMVLMSFRARRRATDIVAGAALTFALVASYFFITNSAQIAFRRVWTENYLADRLAPPIASILLHRIAVPFGFRPLEAAGPRFAAAGIDAATIAIALIGVPSLLIHLVRRWRTPDHLFILGLLQIASFLFVAIMKFIYHYHFEIVLLLMLPFVALALERWRWQTIASLLIVASAVNLFASLFRGKEMDMAYEDFVMREVDRRTPADGKVFDGVGRALQRKPAYQYWFLPTLVEVLERERVFEPYDPREMLADPPAALICDFRLYTWLKHHPQLASIAASNYLPVWRNLWIPAMSGRVGGAGSLEWIAPANGAYRVYASDALANHEWFRHPLEAGTFESNLPPLDLRTISSVPVGCFVDGISVGTMFNAERTQKIRIQAVEGTAVMIVPATETTFFRQPPRGVTLDGVVPAVTHVPFR